ncbi:MAG: site-2 protease family protein [Candidatus Woesearchaeota archaeon]
MALIENFGSFLSSWKFVLLFYIVLAIVIYINRKKFQVENGFILLYRTDFGIKFIERVAQKHKEFLKIVGHTAIGVGFVGMIAICVMLIKGLYNLIFIPSAPATLSLVVPGVKIPGSPIFIPFWYGIIALFIVVVVHEFGHGIIAKANGLKIKNTGFGFFGPLPLAFVEPDEKEVAKKDAIVQQSIFAAGPFFNVILVAVVLALTLLIVNPLVSLMVTPNGVSFGSVQADYPAAQFGIQENTGYNKVNGVYVKNTEEFINAMSCLKPNQSIVLGNDEKNITLITTTNPSDSTKGYIGVSKMQTDYELREESWLFKGAYYVLYILSKLLEWVATLSLGIGLANLLPLGPVDGGRMLHRASIDINGKTKGVKIWATITMVTIVVMIILIFVPIIKHLLLKI